MPLKRIREVLDSIRGIVSSASIMLLILMAFAVVVRETSRFAVRVEPIQVPTKFADVGYTPRVVAQHIIDEVNEIQTLGGNRRETKAWLPDEDLISIEGDWSGPDFIVPAAGMSIKSTVMYLRRLLPLPTIVVSGELLYAQVDDGLSLRLRINGERLPTITLLDQKDQLYKVLQELLQKGAYEIIAEINPPIAGLYLFSTRDIQRFDKLVENKLATDNYNNQITKLRLLKSILRNEIRFENSKIDSFIGSVEKDTQHKLDSPTDLINQGVALAARMDDKGAIEKYYKAIEVDPNSARAYHAVGHMLAKSGDQDKAITYFEKAIKLDSKYAVAYYSWGLALARKNDDDAAIEKYKQALDADPKYAWAYNAWGFALARKNDDDAAIEKYKQALDADSQYAIAYYNWGLALARKNDDDAAIEKYKQALDANPQYASAYVALGFALHRKRDYKGAIERYKQAITIDPGGFGYMKSRIGSLEKKIHGSTHR